MPPPAGNRPFSQYAPIDRNQIVEANQEEYDPLMRRIGRPMYNWSYPPHIDKIESPMNYKIPNVFLFLGQGEQSTLEHIGRFIVQYGHVGSSKPLKLRLFPNSLTRITFTWYTNFSANSVFTWQQMDSSTRLSQKHLWQTYPKCMSC